MKTRRRATRRELEEHVRLPATPEEAARRIFAAAKPPDPLKRKRRSGKRSAGAGTGRRQ